MARERTGLQRKIDSFCRVLFLTEDGRPKSSFLLYSFCLSLVFFVLYLTLYMILIDVIDPMISDEFLRIKQVLEYIVPAIVGTIPCVCLMLVTKKQRNMVVASYAWMMFLTAGILIAMIFACDKSDWRLEYSLFMTIIGIPMVLSSVIGFFVSKFVYSKFFEVHNISNQLSSGNY